MWIFLKVIFCSYCISRIGREEFGGIGDWEGVEICNFNEREWGWIEVIVWRWYGEDGFERYLRIKNLYDLGRGERL